MEALMERQAIEDITCRFQALAAVVPLKVIRTERFHVPAHVFI